MEDPGNGVHPGARVHRLRKLVGLTQEGLAFRAGLQRVEVTKVEGGANRASSFAMRSSLARGFGVSIEQIADLLDGRVAAEDLLPLCSPPPIPASGADDQVAPLPHAEPLP